MGVEPTQEQDLHTGLVGFTVLDRDDEAIGEVSRTSLDRECLFVETRRRLGRSKEHVVHGCVISDIDLDAQTVTLTATRERVEDAPPYSDLEPGSSEVAADYYSRPA